MFWNKIIVFPLLKIWNCSFDWEGQLWDETNPHIWCMSHWFVPWWFPSIMWHANSPAITLWPMNFKEYVPYTSQGTRLEVACVCSRTTWGNSSPLHKARTGDFRESLLYNPTVVSIQLILQHSPLLVLMSLGCIWLLRPTAISSSACRFCDTKTSISATAQISVFEGTRLRSNLCTTFIQLWGVMSSSVAVLGRCSGHSHACLRMNWSMPPIRTPCKISAWPTSRRMRRVWMASLANCARMWRPRTSYSLAFEMVW